jgi:hypothetical protein
VHVLEDPGVVIGAFLPDVGLCRGEGNAKAENVGRLHAGIDAHDRGEALQHEAGANEQDQRERDLTGDERGPDPDGLRTSGTPAPVAQRFGCVDLRGAECWIQPEGETG